MSGSNSRQMFPRFGSEVTILEAGARLIAREDEEVSAAIREVLEGEGVQVRLGARDLSVTPRGDGFALSFDSPSGAGTLDGSHLLAMYAPNVRTRT